MSRIGRQLRLALRGVPGALVESKGLSLSVHYRLVPRAQQRWFHRRAQAVLTPWEHRRRVRVTHGKQVVEVHPPVQWDKGRAVEWLGRRLGRHGLNIYLGDDRTDEDAFRAVNRKRGISVFVGSHATRSRARWWVKGTRETQQLLQRILQVV
jgi:trehalose-phosphatase